MVRIKRILILETENINNRARTNSRKTGGQTGQVKEGFQDGQIY